MSDANREQMSTLANSLWKVFVDDVSKSRKLTADEINNIADNLLCSSPKAALELKLVDQLAYADDAEKVIKSKLNLGNNDKPNYVSIANYAKSLTNNVAKSDKVAVFMPMARSVTARARASAVSIQTPSSKNFAKPTKTAV